MAWICQHNKRTEDDDKLTLNFVRKLVKKMRNRVWENPKTLKKLSQLVQLDCDSICQTFRAVHGKNTPAKVAKILKHSLENLLNYLGTLGSVCSLRYQGQRNENLEQRAFPRKKVISI
jgi:hypothetical protein